MTAQRHRTSQRKPRYSDGGIAHRQRAQWARGLTRTRRPSASCAGSGSPQANACMHFSCRAVWSRAASSRGGGGGRPGAERSEAEPRDAEPSEAEPSRAKSSERSICGQERAGGDVHTDRAGFAGCGAGGAGGAGIGLAATAGRLRLRSQRRGGGGTFERRVGLAAGGPAKGASQ